MSKSARKRRAYRCVSRNVGFGNYETVFARLAGLRFLSRMETWSDRLRLRARELGLTDVEVARRLGLAQGRYSSYVNGTREPDLLLFVRICEVLQTTPDRILGVRDQLPVGRPGIDRLVAAAEGMTDESVDLAGAIVRAMAAHMHRGGSGSGS